VLYYLGRDGVYAFSGNMPTLISSALGEKRFVRGYSGVLGDVLYMSLKDTDGEWGLYSYDTRKRIWLQEDDTFSFAFATVEGKLHFVNGLTSYRKVLTAPITTASGGPLTWTELTEPHQVAWTPPSPTGPVLTDSMEVISITGTDTGDVERSFNYSYHGVNESGDGIWWLSYEAEGDGAEHSVTGLTLTYTDIAYEEKGDSIVVANSPTSTEKVAWEAELAPFTEGTLLHKSPSKLALRCELAAGAWIAAEVSCDNEPFRQVFTSAGRTEPTLVIPIAPRRCDAWRLRLIGQGACVIRGIEREFRVGR
jgi:hypothetical protein